MRAYSVICFSCLAMPAMLASGCSDDAVSTIITPPPRTVDGGHDGKTSPVLPDTGVVDRPDTGNVGKGIIGECGVETNKIFELTHTDYPPITSDTPRTLPLGINRFESRAGFTYIGESAGCTEALYVADIDGPADNPNVPEPRVAVGGCRLYSDPAIAWAAEEAWLLAFVDNRDVDMGEEVHAQVFDPLDDNGSESPGLTNDGFALSTDALRPANVAIAVVGEDRRIVVWTESKAANGVGGGTVHARAVNAMGEPRAPEQVIATYSTFIGSLTVAQLGAVDDELPPSGAVVAFWRYDTEISQIVAIPLDLDAEPKGDERIVRNNVGSTANVAAVYNYKHREGSDLAAGALVYSISESGGRQLWFEMLDNDAELGQLWDGLGQQKGQSKPLRLINSPRRATGASIVAYPQGYVIAYRSLPGGTMHEPEIRVIFLDRTGGFVVDSDVALTTENGGPTAITAGSDGRLVLAWSETEDNITTYKVARLPCPRI